MKFKSKEILPTQIEELEIILVERVKNGENIQDVTDAISTIRANMASTNYKAKNRKEIVHQYKIPVLTELGRLIDLSIFISIPLVLISGIAIAVQTSEAHTKCLSPHKVPGEQEPHQNMSRCAIAKIVNQFIGKCSWLICQPPNSHLIKRCSHRIFPNTVNKNYVFLFGSESLFSLLSLTLDLFPPLNTC